MGWDLHSARGLNLKTTDEWIMHFKILTMHCNNNSYDDHWLASTHPCPCPPSLAARLIQNDSCRLQSSW